MLCFYVVALLLIAGFVLPIILWIIPILPTVWMILLSAMTIASIVGIILTGIELMQLNEKKEQFTCKKQLKAMLGLGYFLIIFLIGLSLHADIQKEENFIWMEQEEKGLASFDDVRDVFLREVEGGYQVLIKNAKHSQEVQTFKYDEVIITEYAEAKPTIQIVDGKSNTWLEKKLGAHRNQDYHLGVKVKANITLPILEESYFANAE